MDESTDELLPAYWLRDASGRMCVVIVCLALYDDAVRSVLSPIAANTVNFVVDETGRAGLAHVVVSSRKNAAQYVMTCIARFIELDGAIGLFRCQDAQVAVEVTRVLRERFGATLLRRGAGRNLSS